MRNSIVKDRSFPPFTTGGVAAVMENKDIASSTPVFDYPIDIKRVGRG